MVTIGEDYLVTPNWLFGGLVNYGYTSGNVQNAHFDANTFRLGLYTSVWHGGWWGTLAGFGGATWWQAGNNPTGSDWTAYIGTGYNWTFGSIRAGPFVSGQFDNVTGFVPLHEFQTRVGGQVSLNAGKWSPWLALAWQHEFMDTWTGISRDSACGAVGIAYRIGESTNIFTGYSIEVGQSSNVQTVDLGLAHSF
jgi:uncharacterized protein with beta-barrel porin domain